MTFRLFNPLNHPAMFHLPERLTSDSAWFAHLPVAMLLVSLLRPRVLVELGVFRGDSYCAFCQAVMALELSTRCYAIDHWRGDNFQGRCGPEVLAELRAYHDPRYRAFSTLVVSSFDEAAANFERGEIDLLHLDGDHAEASVERDWQTWQPKLSARGVVLMHDIAVRQAGYGVWRVWEQLKRDYPYLELLHGAGLGLLAVGSEQSDEFRELLAAGESDLAALRQMLATLGPCAALRLMLLNQMEKA